MATVSLKIMSYVFLLMGKQCYVIIIMVYEYFAGIIIVLTALIAA